MYNIAERQCAYFQQAGQRICGVPDFVYHTVFDPADSRTAQQHHHTVFFVQTGRIADKLPHKRLARFCDILKFINDNDFFTASGTKHIQNITKRRKVLCHISGHPDLHSPLIHLFPFRAGFRKIIVALPVFRKFFQKRRLADMLLPVYDQNLTARFFIILIQIL